MTIEVRENIIGQLTEVRGLLETHGAAAALPRLERHIQDLQETQHVSASQPLYDALSALADMWNQYCPPGVGHAYTSTGEYVEDVLKAAGLMGVDGVASFPPELPAPRPLSSLTEEECEMLWELAFGKRTWENTRPTDDDDGYVLFGGGIEL